jgi:hypothetical protein
MPETTYGGGDGGGDEGASGLSGGRDDSEQATEDAKASMRNRPAVQRIGILLISDEPLFIVRRVGPALPVRHGAPS